MNETLDFIKKLQINEPIVLACSYGPDSMVLLDILLKEQINVIIAHVNHKFRKESDEEYQLLKEYCSLKKIVFEGTEIKELPKGNAESNARNFRYEFFLQILNKYHAKYLFTAHHGDDLIETVLMRLIRGASFKGYGGFEKISIHNNYTLIRPLIYLSKVDIIKYANNNNVPYGLDITNLEETYTRNRVRHHILPELKKENENVHKKFIKYSEMINEYEEYFNKITLDLFQKLYINNQIDINEFSLLDDLLQKRVLNMILFNIYNNKINLINDKHLNLILDLINNQNNPYIVLPNNIRIAKFYNMIIFNYHEDAQSSYDYIVKDEIDTPIGKIIKINETDFVKSNYFIRLSSTEIKLPLHIRTRRNGDYISVKNMQGKKKVNDVLIDEKIPKYIRDIYPILVDNDDNILWIPGVKKSKNDKQKDETYDIILKYVEEGIEDEKK